MGFTTEISTPLDSDLGLLVHLTDRETQVLLREADQPALVVALRGAKSRRRGLSPSWREIIQEL